MPEVYDRFSGDASIYKMIKNAGDWICELEPVILHVQYGRYFSGRLPIIASSETLFIILCKFMIRLVLDILDGGLARKCDKQAKLGNTLTISETVICYVLCYVVMNRVKAPYQYGVYWISPNCFRDLACISELRR